jgi:hypothetical protein
VDHPSEAVPAYSLDRPELVEEPPRRRDVPDSDEESMAERVIGGGVVVAMAAFALAAIFSLAWLFVISDVEVEGGSCGTIAGAVWRGVSNNSGTLLEEAIDKECRDAAFGKGWLVVVPVVLVVGGYLFFIKT